MFRAARALLVGLIPAAACATPDSDLAARIAAAGQRDSVVLHNVATFPWDSVFLFAPYTSSADINRALGFSWSGSRRIESADTFVLLVFTARDKVVRFTEQSRGGADFEDCSRHQAFARSQAVFYFATDSTGWRHCGLAARPRAQTDSIVSQTFAGARAAVEPSAAFERTHGPRGWIISVQDAPKSADWDAAVAQLRVQLNLPDTSAADSVRTVVTIRPGRFVADTFVTRIRVGGWVRCPRVPSGVSETTFEVRSVRRDGVWGPPVARELIESVIFACPGGSVSNGPAAPEFHRRSIR